MEGVSLLFAPSSADGASGIFGTFGTFEELPRISQEFSKVLIEIESGKDFLRVAFCRFRIFSLDPAIFRKPNPRTHQGFLEDLCRICWATSRMLGRSFKQKQGGGLLEATFENRIEGIEGMLKQRLLDMGQKCFAEAP